MTRCLMVPYFCTVKQNKRCSTFIAGRGALNSYALLQNKCCFSHFFLSRPIISLYTSLKNVANSLILEEYVSIVLFDKLRERRRDNSLFPGIAIHVEYRLLN